MLYRITPMGYFSRVYQKSQGPWFRRVYAEEDNLEQFYLFHDGNGQMKILLSNNMAYEDREDFIRLFHAHNRASGLAMFAGFWGALEMVTRMPQLKAMAIGWRVVSFFGIAYGFKSLFNMWNCQTYGPVMGAYFRKYADFAANDVFEITDRKREFYQIDTRQYMSYTHEDLPHGHTNYGPQPDGEVEDSSWLRTMDKFLAGEENHGLQQHKNFLNYPFEFKDKSFPSVEQAADLITKQ